MSETWVIGDIHGCLAETEALVSQLRAAGLQPIDTLVFLGDYVDRGTESAGVISYLLQLATTQKCVFLLGNHEQEFLRFLDRPIPYRTLQWFEQGGDETLQSYARFADVTKTSLNNILLDFKREWVPKGHETFLRDKCVLFYECPMHAGENAFFTHAQVEKHRFKNVAEIRACAKCHDRLCPLLWGRAEFENCYREDGWVFFSGHTPTEHTRDCGSVVFMDSACVYGFELTAMRLSDRHVVIQPRLDAAI